MIFVISLAVGFAMGGLDLPPSSPWSWVIALTPALAYLVGKFNL